MPPKNERVELEMKILKYRRLAQLASDELTRQRIADLIAEPLCPRCGIRMFGTSSGGKKDHEYLRCGHVEARAEQK
jgi:hypothetical protein